MTQKIRDMRYTPHFMETEIDKLSRECVRAYLITKCQEYIRCLSYGSVEKTAKITHCGTMPE